jgi:5-formyltetrahydrofolate cyclo-ligase
VDVARDKSAWRAWARARRREVEPDPAPLVEALAGLLTGLGPGWVVTYRALAHELDLTALEARSDLGPFALTRTPPTGLDLSVHLADGPLERHRWGFDQPAADAPSVPLAEVVAVLVPGLAFDRLGHRLGHGLGYYDRFLARLPARALRIGVVPAALVVDTLPADPHDVPMTHLVTEAGVTPCPRP